MLNRATLLNVLPKLLTPIVRICLKYGVKVGEYEQILKMIFVLEAKSLLERGGELATVSRISAMTGLQRPAANNLLSSRTELSQQAHRPTDILMKVISLWQTDHRYTTKAGKARVLTATGRNSEFAALVHEISQALNPYTVLTELERAGMIKRSHLGVTLNSASLVVRNDLQRSLEFLATDLSDLCAAVEENIANPDQDAPNHHLTTEFDEISADRIPALRNELLKEGNKLHTRLRRIIRRYESKSGCDEFSGAGNSIRAIFGSFSRIEVFNGRGG